MQLMTNDAGNNNISHYIQISQHMFQITYLPIELL